MELKDWTIEHVRARDAIRKTLVSFTEDGETISFTYKHKVHHYLVSPVLHVPEEVKDYFTVVCLNTSDNVDELLAHWDDYCLQNFSVLFVNVGSNSSWSINPRVHMLVADPESLENGIRTMAAEVPFV